MDMVRNQESGVGIVTREDSTACPKITGAGLGGWGGGINLCRH